MYAIQTEVSDGTLVTINVGLEYFEKSEISVTLGEASVPLTVGIDYTWTSDTTIHFPAPVANGVIVRLVRNTEANQMLNIYDGGAPFDRGSLDENFEQLLRLAQEFREGLGLTGLNQNLDMHNYRLTNLGDPLNPKDAVNKTYLDTLINQLIATGTGPIASAINVQYLNPVGGLTNLQALSSAMGYTLIGGLAARLPIYPESFGAVGDGVADDGPAVQAALNAVSAGGKLLGKPGSVYKCVNGVDINNPYVSLENLQIGYPKTTATYYHCLRINPSATGAKVLNCRVTSPAGLVRDDTGFGILVAADRCTISHNVIDAIASAALWANNCTDLIITGNTAQFCLADGFHISNNVRNFVLANNTAAGCHDDSFAVVGDVPANPVPSRGVVANNTVSGSVAGHGVILIACEDIIVANNQLTGTGYAGIGSYFWQLSGAPVAKDWANRCLIIGNRITSPGVAPQNGNNVCGILVGALRNSVIKGNTVYAPTASGLTTTSCIRLAAYQGLTIEQNNLFDSVGYGIYAPDDNVNGAVNMAECFLRGNSFKNIVKDVVRVNTLGSIGVFGLIDNHFYQCAYDGSVTSLFTVTKTGTNLLLIIGNVNYDNDKIGFYDSTTCTNVRCSDNAPAIFISYAPAPVPTGGAFSNVTATGQYYMRGRTVFGQADVLCTTKGTGTGLRINLPKTTRGPLTLVGRENVSSGKACVGTAASSTTATIFTADNGDPLPANGARCVVTFQYESV
jgi:parallel beta-helix repeat protein